MLRKGGSVKRWHTITNAKEQTVAAHSWGVAVIIMDLWPDSRADLFHAALLHDVPEQLIGDVPAPTKWAHPRLAKELDLAEESFWDMVEVKFPALTTEEQLQLKTADMLELLWYCIEEERLGNKNFKEVFVRGVEYVKRYQLCEASTKMLDEIIRAEAEL